MEYSGNLWTLMLWLYRVLGLLEICCRFHRCILSLKWCCPWCCQGWFSEVTAVRSRSLGKIPASLEFSALLKILVTSGRNCPSVKICNWQVGYRADASTGSQEILQDYKKNLGAWKPCVFRPRMKRTQVVKTTSKYFITFCRFYNIRQNVLA